MDVQAPRGLLHAFAQLPDPRVNRTRRHRLDDILTLAICAVICAADAWTQVALHGSLDVNFREDGRRIRQGYGAENFSRLSRIVLNLLKSETTCKVGIKTKRFCCGWDHDYLLKVLTGGV